MTVTPTQHDVNNRALVISLTTWLRRKGLLRFDPAHPESPPCAEGRHEDCPGWFFIGVYCACRCDCHPQDYEP